ncbi:hypothetical protein CMS1689 [Clavibacter sepedonicus]|uniref:Uncharacterized protein n=1 Tax=Clavibacter sepedonicus TaxID=31964 RepID=B0RCN0_CLASE|nr:hypothetical protein CMS1689 [Clavibacter sepedonicus]
MPRFRRLGHGLRAPCAFARETRNQHLIKRSSTGDTLYWPVGRTPLSVCGATLFLATRTSSMDILLRFATLCLKGFLPHNNVWLSHIHDR